MPTDTPLLHKNCKPLPKGAPALTKNQIKSLKSALPHWHVTPKALTREFTFKNYYETLAFLNATAFISHAQNHHPDIEVGYNKLKMRYSTHSVGGLSENDFICAAKINDLAHGGVQK